MKIDPKPDSQARKHKYASIKQALEPRLLFDASLITPDHPANPADQDSLGPPQHAQAETPVTVTEAPINDADAAKPLPTITDNSNANKLQEFTNFNAPAKELVFIDSRLKDPDILIQGLSATTEVHFIDMEHDGIEQIDAVIKAEKNAISAIHILSHGTSGAVMLGNSALTTDSLTTRYADEISSWNSKLTTDANVLLYGCGIAEGYVGQKFVTDLSKMLGVSVAASTDPTGNSMLGGNWDLEFSTGPIEYGPTKTFSQQALAGFYYVLAKPSLDLNGPSAFTASDNFSSGSYTGGTNWQSGWVEFDASYSRAFTPSGSTNSDNSPAGGNIVNPSVATGGTVAGLGTAQEMAFIGHVGQVGDYIGRSINLMSYTAASFSFSYRTAGLTSADAIEVNVSKTGGANFVTLGLLANVTTNTNVTFDISNYISDDTVIQFKVNKGFSTGTSQLFFFDNVNVTADGNNFYSTFSEQTGLPIPIVSNNTTITDADAGQLIKSANVTLSNPKPGDTFAVGALPSGITASIDNVNGTVTLTATNPSGTTAANFVTALKAITFTNTSAALDIKMRTINITVTDAADEVSLPAKSFVKIISYDDPTITVSHSITATPFGTSTGNLFDNSSLAAQQTAGSLYDYDKDTSGLSAALLAQATKGTAVVNADGTFTYTPNAGASGADSFTYSLTSLAQVIGVN
jgi:hypothetical protein